MQSAIQDDNLVILTWDRTNQNILWIEGWLQKNVDDAQKQVEDIVDKRPVKMLIPTKGLTVLGPQCKRQQAHFLYREESPLAEELSKLFVENTWRWRIGGRHVLVPAELSDEFDKRTFSELFRLEDGLLEVKRSLADDRAAAWCLMEHPKRNLPKLV